MSRAPDEAHLAVRRDPEHALASMRRVERLPTRSRDILTGRMVTAYLVPAGIGGLAMALAVAAGASFLTSLLAYVFYVLMLALGVRRWQQRNIVAARTRVDRARVKLTLRQFSEAEAELHAVRDHYARSEPRAAVMAQVVLGQAALLRGEVAEGRRILSEIIDDGWTAPRRYLAIHGATLLADLALADALLGNVDDARRNIDAALQHPNANVHIFLVNRVVVAARSKNWSEVIDLVEQNRNVIESVLTVRAGWYLQVLEAWAREHTPAGYRDDGEGGNPSALSGVRRGCMDHMTGQWPELRAFLEAHQLLDEPTT